MNVGSVYFANFTFIISVHVLNHLLNKYCSKAAGTKIKLVCILNLYILCVPVSFEAKIEPIINNNK